MKRARKVLALIAGAMIVASAMGATSAGAQEDTGGKTLIGTVEESPEAAEGQERPDKIPFEGVAITVTQAGKQIATVKTDAKGKYSIDLPAAGSYEVMLDKKSLPSGKVLRPGTPNPVKFDTNDSRSSLVIKNFPVGAGQAGSSGFTWGRLLNSTVSGLRFGLIIALTAIGLSLIFGTTGLTNFAHGELVTFGAGVALILNNNFGLTVWLAFPIAIIVGAIAGFGNEYLVWQPLRDGQLRKGPRVVYTIMLVAVAGFFGVKMALADGSAMDTIIMELLVVGGVAAAILAVWRLKRNLHTSLVGQLVVSIGLSILFRYLLYFMVGGRNGLYAGMGKQTELKFGPVGVLPIDIGIMAVAAAVLLGVGLTLQKTRIGKAIRAVADNRPLASASGINVQRVIIQVWTIGGALAALGGIMQTIDYGVRFDSGSALLLLMFAGVTLGGLGTAYGALVGSLVVGVIVEVAPLFISSDIKELPALLILVLILLVKPTGILGKSERVG